MFYIASLYSLNAKTGSEEDKAIRQKRYEFTCKKVKELWDDGYIAISPIMQCHDMSTWLELPKEYTYWKNLDHGLIDASGGLLVLCMEDMQGSYLDSEGITDEINYASEMGLPVKYIDCEEYK